MAVMVGMDFFTEEVFTLRGLKTYYVLFFLHLESRRICLAGIMQHPDQEWMYFVGQAFSLLSSLYPDRIDLGIARGKIGGLVKDRFAAQDTSSQMLDAKCADLAEMFQNYH